MSNATQQIRGVDLEILSFGHAFFLKECYFTPTGINDSKFWGLELRNV